MIRRPPRSTLFPTRRSSDLDQAPLRSSPKGAGATARARRRAVAERRAARRRAEAGRDRKSTRLNSSHTVISYAVFCLKKKKKKTNTIKKQTTKISQEYR